MKTKPFNLELALSGHPVIFPNPDYEVLSVQIFDKKYIRLFLNKRGRDSSCKAVSLWPISGKRDGLKLLMPDIDWRANPKFGDLVDVRDYKDEPWEEKVVYLGKKNDLYLIMSVHEFENSNDQECNDVCWFKQVRPHKEEQKLEVTVKVNGKDIDPSTISEETWLNLRKG